MDQSATKSDTSSSVLINYKDEERQMSESLYRNLHVLTRFHEPSAEFLLYFNPYMFVKSNAKAFFPILHFIFNCVDAAEFNKRFRWPILDKTGETNFRKATVDYMNHLNVLHQLGLETLKLSNIHIPGGLKFIKIIHRFTYLAMKLEVNKPEHGPLPDPQNIPDADDWLAKLQVYMEEGMDFVTKLQTKSNEISNKIDEMVAMMESCLESTGLAEFKGKQICWACLQEEWRNYLDRSVADDIAPKLQVINSISKHTIQLNQLLTKLFIEMKENIIQYDKHQLLEAQNQLKKMHPHLGAVIDGIVNGNVINFENLFKVFALVLPNIMNKIETFEFCGLDAMEYEHDEVVRYDAIATKYQDDYNEYRAFIQPFIEKDLLNFQKFCQNNFNLPFNLMHTPPIQRRPQPNRMQRLALIDDLIKKAQLFKEPAQRRPSSNNTVSSNSTMRRPVSCSSSVSSKSREAALQLLARPRTRANLSQTMNISTLSKFSTPKLSSTMATSTATHRNQPQAELKFSPSFPMTPTRVFSENFTETTSVVSPNGISVVRKVATSSVIHLNQPHIRSPTRRFYITDIPPEFAAIMESDADLDAIINETKKTGQLSTNECKEKTKTNQETETAASNLGKVRVDSEAGEFIGDISDSVLKDVLSE